MQQQILDGNQCGMRDDSRVINRGREARDWLNLFYHQFQGYHGDRFQKRSWQDKESVGSKQGQQVTRRLPQGPLLQWGTCISIPWNIYLQGVYR